MFTRKFTATLSIFSLVLFSCMSVNHQPKFDKYYFAVLGAQLNTQKNQEYLTLDRLYDLKKNSKNLDSQLIGLLDYYLGEASGEILDEFITERGRIMLSLLNNKKGRQLECLNEYKSICIDNIQKRDNKINRMIDAIQKGIVLRVEDLNK